MRIALIGLGRMGANIARRLMRGGHEVVGFDRDQESVRKLSEEGADGATSLEELAAKLEAPRIFWVMVPAGAPTEETVAALRAIAQAGDVIIDGGNSFFKDDIRRYRECADHGVHYVDVGTSGGIWGLERGYCLMIGGDNLVVDMLDPIFATLAPGYGTIERTPGRKGADSR
ncbi:MAG TPA: NAD(P)-binding domain-containing protein, partial [Sphingomicrobium sp.]|nr:NAD(P)-binding domain-containing protein [Sphingomicrobium sp.]